MHQKELSLWLRAVVVIGWITCGLLAFAVMPKLAMDAATDLPEFSHLARPCLILFWIGMAPVVLALWHAWRIFTEIGRDNSFCEENARRLRWISLLALGDTVLCVASGVFLLLCNALHPGIFLLMLLIAVVGLGMFAASAALSHLTWKAAALKAENDLTI